MSTSLVPSEAQLGTRPFGEYQVVIDVRTPSEYADDHIPGAINLPLVTQEQFAEVGTLYARDVHGAYLIGAAHALRSVADHIDQAISGYKPGDRILLYCFRGGKRSQLFAGILRAIGFETDLVPGGWRGYRRWVNSNIEALIQRYDYRVLAGLTGSGKTRLLHALREQGAQVLDLEGMAAHRGSLLGSVPGVPQPSQKYFESLLFEQLREFSADRPIWLESESRKIGRLALPKLLHEKICSAQRYVVGVAMDDRVRLLHQDYPHLAADPHAMVDMLAGTATELLGRAEVAKWRDLAEHGDSALLFERVMERYYDPLYSRSSRKGDRGPTQQININPLNAESLLGSAAFLIARERDQDVPC